MMSMQSPLGRVRGLGSAKNGTHHWWIQRVTAVALIPLGDLVCYCRDRPDGCVIRNGHRMDAITFQRHYDGVADYRDLPSHAAWAAGRD